MEEMNLDEMRIQMSILKKKLDKQNIVSERMVKRMVNRKVVDINFRQNILALICLALIPVTYFVFVHLNGMSMIFWAATCVMLLLAIAYRITDHRAHVDIVRNEGDMLETYRKVAKVRKRYADWTLISIPIVLVWLGFYCHELYRVFGDGRGTGMAVVGAVSGLIGLVIGLAMHHRIQQSYTEMMEQMEDLSEE